MKKLRINWPDLELAFEASQDSPSALDESSHYLDLETGQVLVLDPTIRDAVDSIMEELSELRTDESEDDESEDGESDGIALDWTQQDVCQTASYQALPNEIVEAVLLAIEQEYGADQKRFESIPSFNSHESFRWMEAFVEQVRDGQVRQRLADALLRKRPFHQFREAMGSDRRLQQDWHVFEMLRKREAIINWLHSLDVEPLNPDESRFVPPPLLNLRQIMLDETRGFVRLARELPGVQRIALIGSLTTDKEFPKDIDLLVTVSDDCDLSKLAAWGRQLAGRMAAHTSGADIFLANPAGRYIGRTCAWKQCGPGIRTTCDARSCGLRKFLHDDFDSVCLSPELVENPPVILWPTPRGESTILNEPAE